MMVVLQYALGVILMLLPMRVLSFIFKQRFVANAATIRFYFSGRVALYCLAKSCNNITTTVLVPGYICNVLYRAFQEAGLRTISYSTNESFEPSIDEIKKLVNQEGAVILCLAPIMGAEGGQTWMTSLEGISWRKHNGVILFLDMCQDIRRIKGLDGRVGDNYAIISSFNDKAFPGVMGAVALTDIVDRGYSKPSFSDRIGIAKLFIRKLIPRWLYKIRSRILGNQQLSTQSKGSDCHFEYSYCTSFPYTFSHSGATRLQIAVAIAGVLLLDYYAWVKKGYLRNSHILPIKTPYYFTAPYVLVEQVRNNRYKRKRPYAVHGNPFSSARPDLLCFHFKGYDDIR